nr:retrovirus-related Pol polyprotein from transposon TNT 1-94 [Tanacetum cinerariifolium]
MARIDDLDVSFEIFKQFSLQCNFETYVKAKDLDLWHIISNGDFPLVAKNEDTQILKVVPFEEQFDDLKKKLAINNKDKMVLYNALPKKEYKRIFLCKTAKDIWQSLLITHQEKSIDSGFTRFNTIISSLKAIDEGFSSKNYVRKFLRALNPKRRAKVTAIEESKDLSSLALDELIDNLKVHEVVIEKDSEIYRGKKKRVKSIALKAKKESSDDETSTFESDDEEYAMAKGKSDQKCFRCGDPKHLTGDCPKPSRNKDQKAFIRGSWSDSENDAEDKTNDETCLMAQSSNEVCLRTCLEPGEWIKDSGCSKHMTGNKSLFSTYKVYNGGSVIFGSNLKGKIIGKGSSIVAIRTDHGREFDNEVKFGAYCDAQGITHNFSAPRTPQSNRVVERKNRILQEMSRAMLNEQSIPQKFWCNAVDTSTYILNKILIRPMLGKTLYEIFRGMKPSLEYFKVFRRKFFVLNTKDYLTKFDPKSYEGVFLGYSKNSKAYIVLSKHTMKVEEALNVTFDENPPPTKLSPLVDDDVGEEEAIRNNTNVVNNNNKEDESI